MSDVNWEGGNASGAVVRPDKPNDNDEGLVVRPLFSDPVIIVEEPSTHSNVTSVPASLIPVVLFTLSTTRLGWSVRNSSVVDNLYILASPTGIVSNLLYTVMLRPGSYYEDPYHYVGRVTGIWDPAATGAALLTEYLP